MCEKIARETIRGAILIVASLASVQLGSAAAQDIPEPPRVQVSAHGLTANATGGTWCGESTEPPEEGSDVAPGEFCAEAAYPIRTRGRLPVRSHSRVVIHTGEPARSVTAYLMRVRENHVRHVSKLLRVRRLRGSERRFALRLPRRLRRANVLDMEVIYPSANGTWWAGLCSGCVPRQRR